MATREEIQESLTDMLTGTIVAVHEDGACRVVLIYGDGKRIHVSGIDDSGLIIFRRDQSEVDGR